jgi:hypothetical protein
MAKKPAQKPVASSVTRNPGSTATLANKARRVIQSNGIPFFKEWMTKDVTGGRKKKGSRPSCRSVHGKLCNELIARYEQKGRSMDRPKTKPEPKDQNSED